ncbi:unnamed protein product [Vicia faba]|uniref:Uncharacterized protein n=1 Tax=Vicia faba TaxID=3906 RepID=A0AAV1A0Z7_VICFA|nr:unnamed protein product [Vicia faba]
MGDSLREGSDYNTRLYEGKGCLGEGIGNKDGSPIHSAKDWTGRSKKPPILYLTRKDCTALGHRSEGNELGCLSSTLIFYLRAPFACASRAIGALLSSYYSLDSSDGLLRSFPTKIEKVVSHRDVDSFSAPNEMGNL